MSKNSNIFKLQNHSGTSHFKCGKWQSTVINRELTDSNWHCSWKSHFYDRTQPLVQNKQLALEQGEPGNQRVTLVNRRSPTPFGCEHPEHLPLGQSFPSLLPKRLVALPTKNSHYLGKWPCLLFKDNLTSKSFVLCLSHLQRVSAQGMAVKEWRATSNTHFLMKELQ